MQGQATVSASKARSGASDRSIAKSLQEYARGVAGGLLFSLPLLYTMEVWWTGFSSHPWGLLAYVCGTIGLLLGYNRYAGLRRDAGFVEVAIDSVEELGLGLVLSAAILWLLGRVTFDAPLVENLGQIVVEAMTVAVGVSVGTAQLGGGGGDDTGVGEGQEEQAQEEMDGDILGQAAIALCGAVLVGANVAPTEEIVVLAVESTPWRLLALVALSLGFGALILFYSDFTGAQKYVRHDGKLHVLMGTAMMYAIALLASAGMLWFFGRFDGASLSVCVAETVVLGVASTLGASAGRLLLQSSGNS
jgi:putative integral membrane protein (TIGR02587 family)